MPEPRYLAAIALGSNLPTPHGLPPAANLHSALQSLTTLGALVAVSSFHTTAPVGYTHQPTFTNAACLLRTPLAPLPLLHALLAIETAHHRVRLATLPKGPRTLDLDLLLVQRDHPAPNSPAPNSPTLDTPTSTLPVATPTPTIAPSALTLATPALTLPHPELPHRRFVLAPLSEIAPDWPHPTLHRTIAQLLATLP